MVKLALIGKNIAHSQSPSTYEKLLTFPVQYDLINIQKREELPPLEKLGESYEGVNITSPYKQDYLSQVDVDKLAKNLGAINCISFQQSRPQGTNTDYWAIRDIFRTLKDERIIENIFILGSGVMSKTTQFFFDNHHIMYKVLSRKSGDEMSHRDFSAYRNSLIINTCSRNFEFSGHLNETSLFWDYNYAFSPHQSYFDKNNQEFLYRDGYDLLYIQAKYSVYFWKF